jgi:uncharacterized protein
VKADIDQIGDAGLDMVAELPLAWLADILKRQATYAPKEPGRLVAHLTRRDDVVVVQGDAYLALEARCSRCLQPVPVQVHTPLEVTMVPRHAAPGPDAGGELTEDDVGIATYEGHEIDVGGVVRDEVLLELPMQALCQEACKGLCPQCGCNRNAEACNCQSHSGDVRLAQLANIKLA